MRVLLIEDDSATASAIELMLKTDGVDVYITGLGEEGIDLAKVYDYDAILLDLNLTDMSGYEVLRTVRASGVATPIIVSSALGSITDISKAFDLEADDYAVKPFTGESLIRKIRAATRQHAISKSKDDLSRFRKARKDDMIERATFDFYLHFLNTSNMEPDNKVVTGIISSFNFDAAAESMLVKAVSSATPMRLSQICNSVKELLARQLLVAANITWKGREGDDVSLTPPQFIQKYYAADIALGTLTQSKIRQADLSLYTAFYNWRRANKDIPLGFEFPTKHEQTEVLLKQAAESDLEPGAQPARLSWAAQSRARARQRDPRARVTKAPHNAVCWLQRCLHIVC